MDVFRSTHNLLNLSFYLLCVFYTMTVFYLTLQFILSLTVFLCEYSNFRLCYYFTLWSFKWSIKVYYVSLGYNKSLSWVVWEGEVLFLFFFFWNDPSSDEQSLILPLPCKTTHTLYNAVHMVHVFLLKFQMTYLVPQYTCSNFIMQRVLCLQWYHRLHSKTH